jgi:DNA repair protein RadC
MAPPRSSPPAAAEAAPSGSETPHYLGHRERLRDRLLNAGAEALPDYELLEFLLFAARPRGDVKPLAKALLKRFGSFAAVLGADKQALLAVPGMGEASVAALLAVRAASLRLLHAEVARRPVIGSSQALLDYCTAAAGYAAHEEFRLLFLDKKNALILDEQQHRGTVDHTPVYPREVVKRALELGASAIIMVHNHFFGATPWHSVKPGETPVTC